MVDPVAPEHPPTGPRRRLADAWAGLVSAGAALGAGELVAGLTAGWNSPVVAVAETVIDTAPRPAEHFAIETFGSNDKVALVGGVLSLCALFGVALGLLARRRPALGAGGFAVFGLAGMGASLRGSGPTAGDALPALVALVVGTACLAVLIRPPAWPPPAPVPPGDPGRELVAATCTRRRFLALSGVLAVTAGLAATSGRALRSRFSAAASRARVVLPRAASPLPAVPPGVTLGVPGVAPFATSNRSFYRVDTALLVPQVRAEDWSLSVLGLVERPLEISFEQILARRLVEADITLTCVSNTVGGDLVGSARWLGVPVRELLDEAGVRAGADQIVGRSVDGYTCGFPLSAVYDRMALVAVGMNGEPLPLDHGFPARLVTPGLYGYVSATKWLAEIEVSSFSAFDQYWVRRGWDARAPVKTMARIDSPRSLSRIAPGPRLVGGVAWAQTRGISRVEVRLDDGAWEEAELGESLNRDTWRQWRWPWEATPGPHRLSVRATDGTGATQTEERAEPFPNGASGWMTVLVTVTPPGAS